MVVILVTLLLGCGGASRVSLDINIPNLSEKEFYDSPYMDGWKKLKEGKPDLAMESFNRSNLEDEKLFVAFGYTLMLQKKMSLSRQNFLRALEINPDNIQAELGMATLFELSRDVEQAFRMYGHLRAKYPENVWIKLRFDHIRSTQTQFYLNKAEELKSENNNAYIRALENAARYSEDIIEIKIRIADFYYQNRQYENAAVHYEKIIEKMPNREDILFKLGWIYEQLNKYDSALIIYKRILDLKPGDKELTDKITNLKIKFYESNLPVKFKNIFFKYYLNREDLAALLGHYFNRYLKVESVPIIITDISGSFARDYIIKLCTLKIMDVRPDHRFQRFTDIDRSALAVILYTMTQYLKNREYPVKINPLDEVIEPADISPLHKYYEIIKFVINAQFMKLDSENQFNPTERVSPSEALISIRKLLNSID